MTVTATAGVCVGEGLQRCILPALPIRSAPKISSVALSAAQALVGRMAPSPGEPRGITVSHVASVKQAATP